MGGEPPHSTLPMLALHTGMDRLRLEAGVGSGRPERPSSHARRTVDHAVDRAVRLTAVSTDLELALPPSIALPDGEEYPYGASSRLHIRDPEQESEIYQKCIRPPPNRTVFDGESPPPYRTSSASSASASFGGGGSGGSGSSLLRHPHAPHAPHPAHPHPAGLAGFGLPAVIVPSPARKQDPAPGLQPGLLLAGPASTAKHSTGPVPLPPPGSTASTASTAGLVRLLSPSAEPRRVPTVRSKASSPSSGTSAAASASASVCRTAHSAAPSASAPCAGVDGVHGVDLVSVNSACPGGQGGQGGQGRRAATSPASPWCRA
ncbi:immediate early response gene 5-like protein isoform X2 [Thrips palmi]|uniref:Immediate early response gene 5-like protein isoform X2 n=1 Tax=Thrips palmi TaxID=161013 RepID=A0A6P9A093_THRPL|nr:immediate early response gene 5-like protein isoform X2 [Thrips palmi]